MSELMAIGKSIRMPCMRRGLCAYPKETILVSQEALIFLSNSARGIPVVIDHPVEIITDDNVKSMPIVGRVSNMEYDSISDLWYAEFIIDNQEGLELLQSGYGVSTAWFGDKYADGGTHNNCGYDRELIEGRYEHLAIVKTPRYEMAVNPIFLNSNALQTPENDITITNNETHLNKKSDQKGNSMIGKIFKKFVKREEITTNEGEDIFVNIDGEDKPISHLISELQQNKKNEDEKKEEKEPEKKMANESDEVDVDGEKITVNELVKRYKSACSAKKNETEAEKEKEEKVAKDVEKLKEEKSENSIKEDEKTQKNFEMIKSVHENGITYELEDKFLSLKERAELGRQKYGKK